MPYSYSVRLWGWRQMRYAPDTPITLQKRKQAAGRSSEYTVEAQAELLCSVSVPGLRLKADAAAVGYGLDLTVQLWRSEFEAEHYTHAILDGREYRIAGTSPGRNELYVRLALSRN